VSDWLLIDGVRRLLGDTCTFEVVQAAEAEGWSPSVWDAVAGAGFASLSELPLADALAVVTVAGATLTGPDTGSSRSQAASTASASGTGAACSPATVNTASASASGVCASDS